MPTSQNYANHARLFPPFHFFVLPVFLLNFLITIVVLIRHWPEHIALHAWLVVMAFTLLGFAGVARMTALTVQDRVIRLEESLRYQRLLTPAQLAASQSLTIRQIIALRFASDAELPALLDRTLRENLPPKAIKQAVTTWRADHLRA